MERNELPMWWRYVPLKSKVEILYGRGLPKRQREENGIFSVYGSNGIVGQHISSITAGPTIIIGRKGSVGAVHYSAEPCWPIDTTFYIDQFPDDIDASYLSLFLRSEDLASLNIHAAIPGIRREDLYELPLPIPYPDDPTRSLAEQRRIVARIEAIFAELRGCQQTLGHLQKQTGRLMEAILVETFSEFTQKFSGERSIEEMTTVTSGGTPSRSKTEYYEGTIPWIKTGELKDNFIYNAEEYITDLAIQNSSAKQFPVDTLLIAMYGQGQTRGRTGLLKINAATNQACCAIYPNPDEFNSHYLQYWFRHMYSRLRQQSEARGGTQPNLNQSIIKNLKPPLPPVDEQKHTANILSMAEREISDMQKTQSADARNFADMEQAILNQAFRGEI